MSTATASQGSTSFANGAHRLMECATSECLTQINVGDTERALSALAGGALIVLAPHTFPGWMMKAMGCGLLYRAITGHCFVYQGLEMNTVS